MAALLAPAIACSQPQSAPPAPPTPTITVTAAPTPTAAGSSPEPAAHVLFAVVEDSGHPGGYRYDTIAIAGLDGLARAKATFTPMPVPEAGCYGRPPMPVPATTAAGAAFFADSMGVIRKLSIDGTVTTITTFPLTSPQQVLSFVVSPDGTHLLGAVLTFASRPAGDPCGRNAPFSYFYGDPTNEVYSAEAGGPARPLYRETWSQASQTPINLLRLKSWTAAGPRGTSPSVITLQGAGPGFEDGRSVRVDAATGKVLGPLVVSDCILPSIAASGYYSCMPADALLKEGDTAIMVLRPDGSEIWRALVRGLDRYGNGLVSPDEKHLVTQALILGQDGSRAQIPAVYPMGWVDSRTVLVVDYAKAFGAGSTGYLSLDDPGKVVYLGFDGYFAGSINGR